MERSHSILSSDESIFEHINRIPLGYSEVRFRDRKYGTVHTVFNGGKSHKVYAEELGGNDVISLNYYRTNKGEDIKPCEMSLQKVVVFLRQLTIPY